MKINIICLLLVLLHRICCKSIKLKQRPVIVFHGFLMSCRVALSQGFENYNYRCIESGNGLKTLEPLSNQGDRACRLLKKMIKTDKKAFKNGFYMLGFSLGGLVARYVLHYCKLPGTPIKRLITMSTPNLGLRGFPSITSINFRSFISDAKLAIKEMLTMGGGLSFKWLMDNNKRWDEKTSMIELYNIFTKKATIVEKFEEDNGAAGKYNKLEMLVALASRDEVIIKPFASATFGAKYNKKTDRLRPFKRSSQYKQNYMGLKDMYDDGRFMVCLNKNVHNVFKPKVVHEINQFLSDDCMFDRETFSNVSKQKLYELCLYKKISSRKKDRELLCRPNTKYMLKKPSVQSRISKINGRRKLYMIERIKRRLHVLI